MQRKKKPSFLFLFSSYTHSRSNNVDVDEVNKQTLCYGHCRIGYDSCGSRGCLEYFVVVVVVVVAEASKVFSHHS